MAPNAKKGSKRAPSPKKRSAGAASAASGSGATKATARGAGGSSAKKAAAARKTKRDGEREKPGRRPLDRVRAISASQSAAGARPDARKTRESAEAAEAAISAALDKKALMPVLINVSALASYTDFIGIVSGRSDRQVDAIAEGVLQAMKARGRSLLGQEGSGSGRWTLLDFGDVVIHVFYHPVREFYDLESLWVDAPRVPLKIPPEAVIAQPDALYGSL